MKTVCLLALAGLASSEIFYQENFESNPFDDNRWIVSNWKQDSGEAGALEYSGGLWPADDSRNGIRTTEDARFYSVSSALAQPFDNAEQTLVFQFSVKHEQKIDCGGGYVKLLGPDADASNFDGETEYTIMFGPDICGYSTKKVQAIFNFNGENLLKTDDVTAPDDEFTHFYTLVVNTDSTYEIWVDNEVKDSGDLKDAWEFELPRMIKDPEDVKPEDWVDDEMMDDPEDVKPDNWDDEPESIADPDASKPEDWDDEEDGEWMAPTVPNPEYRGVWRPNRIENPDYQGPWVQKEIENPDFVEQDNVYQRGPIGFVGIEIWQVKSGTVFSDFLMSNDVEDARAAFAARAPSRELEEAAQASYTAANTAADDDEDDEDEAHAEL